MLGLANSRFFSKAICLGTAAFALLLMVASGRLKGQQGQAGTLLHISQVQGTDPLDTFVEDEFIVVLKKEFRGGFRTTPGTSNRPTVNAASVQQLIDRHSVERFKRQFAGARTEPANSNRPDLSGHYKVRLPRGASLDLAIADFSNDPHVERVEKIGIHPLYLTPNDSLYVNQWNHRGPYGIDSDIAWNTNTGHSNVVVAILDTGVRYQHADLNGNIWTNSGEIAGNGVDDDGNGYVDDVVGYDFVESATGASLFTCCDSDCSAADNDPGDHNGHGTHLAGIVAATTNNGFGVAGIAGGYGNGTVGSASNGIKIMPLRIGWNGAILGLVCGTGLIRMDYAAEALHYVAVQKSRGVNIAAVNASWGSSDTGGLGAAVDELLASDVMIVHAAGNSNVDTADFLGTKAGVMNVAATDANGNGASFTNYGDWVDLSAPGVDITSLWVGPDPSTEYFATMSGTSMATPHAAGVAALLESFNPALSGPQKFNLMVANTKPYISDGRNLGSGILNANLALAELGPASPSFFLTASPGSRSVNAGGSTSYNVTIEPLAGFNGTVTFSTSGLPTGIVASFNPPSLIGSGSCTVAMAVPGTVSPGTYPITITATSGGLSRSSTVTLEVSIPGEAAFAKTDTTTQGSWKGVYGAEGYAITNHATNYPAYAQVSVTGQNNHTWAASTTNVQALQKETGSDRIASSWWSATTFSFDVNLLDGNRHQVGIYCVDYDNWNRAQRVDILDAATGTVLDSRSLSGFQNGRYLVWNLTGHVKIQLTMTAVNAVVSGIFFDLPAPPDFVPAALPALQSVAAGGAASYNVSITSLAGFAGLVNLSAAGLPSGIVASFSPNPVVGSGASTMTVTASLTTPGGSYPITITATSGSLSRTATVTLLAAVPVPAASVFLTADSATRGSWKGVYGAEGYAITNHATNYPAYAQVSVTGQNNHTWAASTTNVQALQKETGSDRIASSWWSATTFSFDVNLLDGNRHQVGIYCVDYDNWNRAQRVDILDAATGTVLDSRSLSGFQNGRYLVWNLTGHVKIQLTMTAVNAVVSGIFFDLPAPPDFVPAALPALQSVAAGGAASYNVSITSLAGFAGLVNLSAAGLPSGIVASFSPNPVVGSGSSTMTLTTSAGATAGSYPITITATSGGLSHTATVTLHVSLSGAAYFVTTNTTTQGSWKGVYGAEGYAIANHATNYPSYAQVSVTGQTNYTWAASTTSVQALQKETGSDRIASSWWSATTFSFDVNLLDGNWHQVGIYCVDYDNWNRGQRIDILDAATGNVLDSRNLSGFQGGHYLVWNLKGHVKIRATQTAVNAVVSGIFFDFATPTFSISPTPALRTVPVGEGATFNLTLQSSGGFSDTVSLSASGLPAGATASFEPASVVGSGASTMTVTASLTTPGGSYPITITATSGSLSRTATVTLLAAVPVPAASVFLTADSATRGSWKGVYGAEGYAITNHATNYPAYAQVSVTGQNNHTWAASTTNVQALQKETGSDRIASSWWSATTFSFDVNLLDGNRHQVGIYCVDYDNWNRAQRVDILDAATGTVLDSRSLSGFQNGRYLVWNLTGHVKIQLTMTAVNAVVSGIFFDLPAPPDFVPAALPALQSVAAGGAASYNVSITSLAGFAGLVNLSAAGLPSGIVASFSPNPVVGSGSSTMTLTTSAGATAGSYPITITATSGGLSHTATVTLHVSLSGAAYFVTTNTTTQGSWKGVYGAEGYAIANHATNYPSYAQVSVTGQTNYTWAASTTSVQALQKETGSDRIASSWWSATTFSFDVNLLDGNWHQVGIYCVDYDNWNRGQRIDILDAATGNVLDSRNLSGFQGGHYLVWNLKGHVKIRATQTAVNAVVSGIFFDFATPTFSISPTPALRTVPVGEGATFNLTLQSSGGFSDTVSLSASGLPAGATASFEPASVVGSGASTMTVTASLTTPGGSYPITITATSGSLSRTATVTLLAAVPVPAASVFLTADSATRGSWKGVYGAEGYAITNHATNYPAYAQVSVTGQNNHTWAASTTNVQALQKETGSDRIASSWWSATTFSFDVNLLDGNRHQVGIYCVDYDNWNRAQRVDILDAATGTVLDSRSLSGFQNGRYLVWNLTGHVKIQLTMTAVNAVVSGIFFK